MSERLFDGIDEQQAERMIRVGQSQIDKALAELSKPHPGNRPIVVGIDLELARGFVTKAFGETVLQHMNEGESNG